MYHYLLLALVESWQPTCRIKDSVKNKKRESEMSKWPSRTDLELDGDEPRVLQDVEPPLLAPAASRIRVQLTGGVT